MIDTKRKGKLMYCKNCHKKTRHVSTGNVDRELNKNNKVSKFQWLMCKDCGHTEIINRW